MVSMHDIVLSMQAPYNTTLFLIQCHAAAVA